MGHSLRTGNQEEVVGSNSKFDFALLIHFIYFKKHDQKIGISSHLGHLHGDVNVAVGEGARIQEEAAYHLDRCGLLETRRAFDLSL